ncbi:MAG: emp24/gp25L/p24 family protein [Thaumarchaeota archaeon]|nr:emp24/gp25L/p24 family protein [Nitrososphaerota archaeon]
MAISIGVVIILIVAFFAIGSYYAGLSSQTGNGGNSPPSYMPETVTVFSGSTAVNANQYSYTYFTVPSDATNVVLSGNLQASGGSGNDVIVYIFDSTDFINWQNGHTASALYSTGQETAFNINIGLPSGDTYYVVFDNTFSLFSGKTVTGTLTLSYDVPSS